MLDVNDVSKFRDIWESLQQAGQTPDTAMVLRIMQLEALGYIVDLFTLNVIQGVDPAQPIDLVPVFKEGA